MDDPTVFGPRCIPADFAPVDGRRGEWAVWDQLRRELPPEAVLLHSAKVPGGPSGREIDLLVAWPGVGLAVVEVKGGAVSCDAEGRWHSHRDGQSRPSENPMEQVETARHELSRYLAERHARAARARIQHLVVLPHARLPAGFDPASCPRQQVVDVADLTQLVPRLRALVETGANHEILDAADLPALVSLFVQALPVDDRAGALEHEQGAEQYASQQLDVLDLLSRQRRYTVIGGAGTGKTGLALEQARRLAQEGKRTALVCYSRGLARFLQERAAGWTRPPAYVGTFHGLAHRWGAEQGDGSDYYEFALPTRLGELAPHRPDRFDAVVVDEAQDFGELWWTALLACLQEPADGGVFAFLDDDQRVFERLGAAPVQTQPYPLRRNYRNTKRIAQTFGSLATDQVTFGGRQGTRVRYVSCQHEEVMDRADDAVDALLEVWEPHQIALLTTNHRHPIHREQIQHHGDDTYWSEFFAMQDVCYGSVSGFKGLERTCVVLAVDGFSADARAKQMLYVGLSRARAQLVVVGDLDEIAPKAVRPGLRKRLLDAEPWQPPRQ